MRRKEGEVDGDSSLKLLRHFERKGGCYSISQLLSLSSGSSYKHVRERLGQRSLTGKWNRLGCPKFT